MVRVEKAGVVVCVPGLRLSGGEDVRVWLAVEETPYTFEASVIRSSVPVPDRSQDGLLLGFIDAWAEGAPLLEVEPGRVIDIVPPNGPPISLLEAPVRIVDLSVTGLAFAVPASFKLVFVEAGVVTVRLGTGEVGTVEVAARVKKLAPGEGHLLYGLLFEEVADAQAHREVVEALA